MARFPDPAQLRYAELSNQDNAATTPSNQRPSEALEEYYAEPEFQETPLVPPVAPFSQLLGVVADLPPTKPTHSHLQHDDEFVDDEAGRRPLGALNVPSSSLAQQPPSPQETPLLVPVVPVKSKKGAMLPAAAASSSSRTTSQKRRSLPTGTSRIPTLTQHHNPPAALPPNLNTSSTRTSVRTGSSYATRHRMRSNSVADLAASRNSSQKVSKSTTGSRNNAQTTKKRVRGADPKPRDVTGSVRLAKKPTKEEQGGGSAATAASRSHCPLSVDTPATRFGTPATSSAKHDGQTAADVTPGANTAADVPFKRGRSGSGGHVRLAAAVGQRRFCDSAATSSLDRSSLGGVKHSLSASKPGVPLARAETPRAPLSARSHPNRKPPATTGPPLRASLKMSTRYEVVHAGTTFKSLHSDIGIDGAPGTSRGRGRSGVALGRDSKNQLAARSVPVSQPQSEGLRSRGGYGEVHGPQCSHDQAAAMGGSRAMRLTTPRNAQSSSRRRPDEASSGRIMRRGTMDGNTEKQSCAKVTHNASPVETEAAMDPQNRVVITGLLQTEDSTATKNGEEHHGDSNQRHPFSPVPAVATCPTVSESPTVIPLTYSLENEAQPALSSRSVSIQHKPAPVTTPPKVASPEPSCDQLDRFISPPPVRARRVPPMTAPPASSSTPPFSPGPSVASSRCTIPSRATLPRRGGGGGVIFHTPRLLASTPETPPSPGAATDVDGELVKLNRLTRFLQHLPGTHGHVAHSDGLTLPTPEVYNDYPQQVASPSGVLSKLQGGNPTQSAFVNDSEAADADQQHLHHRGTRKPAARPAGASSTTPPSSAAVDAQARHAVTLSPPIPYNAPHSPTSSLSPSSPLITFSASPVIHNLSHSCNMSSTSFPCSPKITSIPSLRLPTQLLPPTSPPLLPPFRSDMHSFGQYQPPSHRSTQPARPIHYSCYTSGSITARNFNPAHACYASLSPSTSPTLQCSFALTQPSLPYMPPRTTPRSIHLFGALPLSPVCQSPYSQQVQPPVLVERRSLGRFGSTAAAYVREAPATQRDHHGGRPSGNPRGAVERSSSFDLVIQRPRVANLHSSRDSRGGSSSASRSTLSNRVRSEDGGAETARANWNSGWDASR
eukprot:GHVS01076046.1.p1 GENE.GHVS01076046.1~~GHVS01076046.1.p1  ORF type:complete len:1204 (-),score=132.03 GHVS01076046.1:158-3508(-)